MTMFLILSGNRLRVRMLRNELNDDIDALKEKYMEDVTALYVSLGDEIDFRSSMMHLIRALGLKLSSSVCSSWRCMVMNEDYIYYLRANDLGKYETLFKTSRQLKKTLQKKVDEYQRRYIEISQTVMLLKQVKGKVDAKILLRQQEELDTFLDYARLLALVNLQEDTNSNFLEIERNRGDYEDDSD